MIGPPADGDQGLATANPGLIAGETVNAWQKFTSEIAAAHKQGDLSDTDIELIAPMGAWPDQPSTADLLTLHATDLRGTRPPTPVAPPGTSLNEALDAIYRNGEAITNWLENADYQDEGLKTVLTQLGPLPLLTALHSTTNQIAVTELLLAGHEGVKDSHTRLHDAHFPQPDPRTLAAGVRATTDTVGALAARAKVDGAVGVATDPNAYLASAARGNWRTSEGPDALSGYRGPVVTTQPEVLLLITSGRADVGRLYRNGDLRVNDIAGLIELAPALSDVPGVPVPELGRAAKWALGAGAMLSRLARGG